VHQRLVGITTTIPVEVLFAAGYTPLDLNNVFIGSADAAGMVEAAEQAGFPRTMCAWVKGIYAAAHRREVGTVVAVVQGDCSNTHALMEILESEGVRAIDFAFPYKRERPLLAAQLTRLADRFGTTLEAAEAQKARLDAVRATVHEIDRLAWETGQVTPAEAFTWQVNCSDFEGEPEAFGARAEAFLAAVKERPPGYGLKPARQAGDGRRPAARTVRLGLVGVPPICADLHERLAEVGAAVVFHEVARQFAMPGRTASLVEQYAAYTYPYDVFFRIEDIVSECRRRQVQGVVHYVQSFCFRQIQDRLLRERLGLAVLTLECDRPGPLDAASRTRLEAFVEMLRG